MNRDKKQPGQYMTNAKMFFKMFLVSILFTLAATITLAGIFLEGNTLDNLLFYARVPISDGSSQAITNCVKFCLPVAISVFLTTNILSFVIILMRKQIKRDVKYRFEIYLFTSFLIA